jgi:hypothetical protein
VDETNDAMADKTNEAIGVGTANKAIVVDKVVKANDAAADKLPINNKCVIVFVIVYFLFGFLVLYSLTKYSTIFVKAKECFGFCFDVSNNFGLGGKCINQLEKLVAEKGRELGGHML